MVQLVPCFSCRGFFAPGQFRCPNCGARKNRVRVGIAGAGGALITFVACNCYGIPTRPCFDDAGMPRACFVFVPPDAGADAGDGGPTLGDAGTDSGIGLDAGTDAGDGG